MSILALDVTALTNTALALPHGCRIVRQIQQPTTRCRRAWGWPKRSSVLRDRKKKSG